jgi:protein tyrosine phosphatase (PTP) superfamily phosphohydrolase (DUF442 family)
MRPVRIPGITIANFGVVAGVIFRGAEPKDAQFDELARLGIRTVVSLRSSSGPAARERVERLGMRFVQIPMARRRRPTDAQAEAFLRIATDPDALPIYVYCVGGRHRTASLIAVYRVAVDGWTADRALREMDAYGFYDLFGLHSGFKRYVVEYSRGSERPRRSPPGATRSTDRGSRSDRGARCHSRGRSHTTRGGMAL